MSSQDVSRSANFVDDAILRYADSKSPQEISQILKGVVSPSAVAAHTQKLLKSRDWLTAQQEEQLILLKMRELLIEIEDNFQDDKMLGLRLKTLEKLGAIIEKRKAATEVDLTKLYSNEGKLMGQVVDEALSYMKGALREKVDPDLWDTLVGEALVNARSTIAKHEAIEE